MHYQIYNYSSSFCKRSNMYQCVNSSKCISRHRLNDGILDCPKHEDENGTVIDNGVSLEEIPGNENDYEEQLKKKEDSIC